MRGARPPKVSLGNFAIKRINIDARWEPLRVQLEISVVLHGSHLNGTAAPAEVVFRRCVSPELLERPDRYAALVHSMVCEAVMHEIDEWFCVDGVRRTDPHAGNA